MKGFRREIKRATDEIFIFNDGKSNDGNIMFGNIMLQFSHFNLTLRKCVSLEVLPKGYAAYDDLVKDIREERLPSTSDE